MGFGSFRYRFVLIVAILFLLWHSSKIWYSAVEEESTEQVRSPTTISNKVYQDKQRVRVRVFYEALCPDSRSFFLKQLVPTYERIYDYMQVELIPYGKATTEKTDNGYEFKCQHGADECLANIIHACCIDVIQDLSLTLQFLSCMIKNNLEPVGILETCAGKFDVDRDAIAKCYQSERGKQLLAMYGEMTKELSKPVTFIPTIQIDGSTDNLAQTLKNLLKQVCTRFEVPPKACLS